MPGPTCSRRAGSELCRLCVTAPSKCESRCAASSTPPDAKDVVTTHRHGLCARSVASPRLSDTTVPDTAPSLSCASTVPPGQRHHEDCLRCRPAKSCVTLLLCSAATRHHGLNLGKRRENMQKEHLLVGDDQQRRTKQLAADQRVLQGRLRLVQPPLCGCAVEAADVSWSSQSKVPPVATWGAEPG